MNSLAQRIEYIRWLKIMGIEYYFLPEKDSNFYNLTDNQVNKYNATDQASLGISKIGKNIMAKMHNVSDKGSSNINLDSITSIEKLKETLLNFDGCRLKDFAMNTVFADGVATAKIMLIGEAPGAKEDERGIPFCGESGQLLDTMLNTINLSRQKNIYITNTVFWRPPANRQPTKQEVELCKPFLEKHIALVKPELIVCVGSTAVAGLLSDKINITNARNQIHHYQNQYLSKPIDTMAIFHPAYLLRQPAKKKDSWFDLMKIKKYLDNLKTI